MSEIVVRIPWTVRTEAEARGYAAEHGIDLSRPHVMFRDPGGDLRVVQERPEEGLFKGDFI